MHPNDRKVLGAIETIWKNLPKDVKKISPSPALENIEGIYNELPTPIPDKVKEAMEIIKLVLLGRPEEKKGGYEGIDPIDKNLACQAFEQVLLAVFVR